MRILLTKKLFICYKKFFSDSVFEFSRDLKRRAATDNEDEEQDDNEGIKIDDNEDEDEEPINKRQRLN